jgi:hypothetical protein
MDKGNSSLVLVKSEQGAVKVLPADYTLCPIEDLVVLIADMLSEVIQINDQHIVRNDDRTRFHSRFVL